MKRKQSLSSAHLLALLLLLGAVRCLPCSSNSTIVASLPTLGGSFLQISALNAAGQMTGLSTLPEEVSTHAMLIGNTGISDLGTLGGTYSQGFAVNASGQVVGEANPSDNVQIHAFLYSGGAMVDLGTLGGSYSTAVAINDAGEVTGNSLTTDDSTFEAFRYLAGSMVGLGTLGGSFSEAVDINAGGAVTGSSSTEFDLETHAFLFTDGTMVDLGTMGGFYSSANGLNDANVVVGEFINADFELHAFVYAGTMQDIGTLGGTYSSASAINNAGQVIGVASTSDDAENHGFLYSGGTLTDLGTLGGNYSSPAALNSLGQVVGDSATSNGDNHAFLWQNGTMTDLNTMLPPDSGWVLNRAIFINDAGRIVGVGTYNGVAQWFVLDPGSSSVNNPPAAAAGADQNVSCQTEVTLDGSGSSDSDGDSLSYQWSYAGNVFSTQATAVVLFDIGVYTITLTVTDPCGGTSQDQLTVNVTDTLAPTVSAPSTVSVAADANCEAAVPDVASSVAGGDNCTPANALVIAQNPAAGTLLGGGQHTIVVTVTDASGNVATANVTLHILDMTVPTIVSSPSELTVSTGENCQGIVPDLTSQVVATDNCTPAAGLTITQSPAAGTLLERGQHVVNVHVTDAAGNSATTTVSLTIADAAAPVIASVTANPPVLWSPNKQLVPVTVTVLASDDCDGAPVSEIISVTANEPLASNDVQITGNLTLKLAAAKGSSGSERVYTITVRCTDLSGNNSTGTVTVTVPKNQSGDDAPVTSPTKRP